MTWNYTKTLLILIPAQLFAGVVFHALGLSSDDKALAVGIICLIVLGPVFLTLDIISAWKSRRAERLHSDALQQRCQRLSKVVRQSSELSRN